MELQEIEVQISKDGKVELTVRGVKGQKCLDITRDLEESLGGEILLREMTPEAQDNNPAGIDQPQETHLGD